MLIMFNKHTNILNFFLFKKKYKFSYVLIFKVKGRLYFIFNLNLIYCSHYLDEKNQLIFSKYLKYANF
jgi:hypothetical protein